MKLETKRRSGGPTWKVKDEEQTQKSKTPTLSFMVAQTLSSSSDGMTRRDIAEHIMRTYPHVRSVDLSMMTRSVGNDISRSKFYFKKEKISKNGNLWAIRPEYESLLKDRTSKSYRPYWKNPHQKSELINYEKVRQKKSSESATVDNCSASSDLKTEEFEESEESEEHELNVMNRIDGEAIIPQLDERLGGDIQGLLKGWLNQSNINSGMCINEQENTDIPIPIGNLLNYYCGEYMNHSGSAQTVDGFVSTNNEDVTNVDDNDSNDLEDIKFFEFPNIYDPMNATISTEDTVDNQMEVVPTCPLCNLSLHTYEELGKHVQNLHKKTSNVNQNGILKDVLGNLRSDRPIKIYIVTGNQNIYMENAKKQG